MDDICRLCCSTHFVNNYIFDEENALFLKMSLYLPIKVFKNDRLPQKICDKCSCKVNDFYQFCNETIEVQNRLNHILSSSKTVVNERVDFTIVKQNASSPPPAQFCEQSTQTEQENSNAPTIKTEPKILPSEVKKENDFYDADDFSNMDIPSDNSEEEFLIDIKKKKKSKNNSDTSNGVVKAKRGRKRKTRLTEQDILSSQTLTNGLPVIREETEVDLDLVKEEIELRPQEFGKVLDSINGLKEESNYLTESEFYCCMCLAQCSSRLSLLKHYKEHGRMAERAKDPPPPPLPDGDSSRCLRCHKVVLASQWAEHWRRHFARDAHPFRCALCEVTYRDHYRILKHANGTSPLPRVKRILMKRSICVLHKDHAMFERGYTSQK